MIRVYNDEMAKPGDVANYFLTLQDDDAGDLISNLKLQKLLYYAQGFHLALCNKRLFDEDILAWAHGPVVRSIYNKYKVHKDQAIPKPSKFNQDALSKKERDLLNEVYKVFGQFSAWKLRNMTHAEPPWRNTEQNDIIPESDLTAYFKTQLV